MADQDLDFSRQLDELDEPEATGFGTPVAEPSQSARDAFDLPGATRKLIDDVVSRREAEQRQSDYVEKGKEVLSALSDPQQYAEFAKGIVPGGVSFGGTVIQAPDTITARGQQGAAKFGRKQLDVMDRIDRGEPVPEMEDPIGYAYMSTEQRQAARRDQERATAEFNPTPIEKRPFFKAGEKVQQFAKELMPAAPGYEESTGRQLGEGMGSMVFGLPFAYFGAVPAGIVFGSAGIGEATQRAVEFDRKEKAAGRPGLTEDQISLAGILGVGPGATDLLPIEVLMGRLPIPLPPALRRPVAMAIGRIGGQALIEGAQEGGQAFLQNLIAREVYNPEQPLVDGIGHEMGIGAGVGGIAQTAKELGVWMLKSGAIRRKKGVHDSLVEHEKAKTEAAEAAPAGEDTRALAPSQEGPTPRLGPGEGSVRGAVPTEPAIQDAERLLSEINQGTIAQGNKPEDDGTAGAPAAPAPTPSPVEGGAAAPVPTFQDVMGALPRDSAGDPDLSPLIETLQGRPYNTLTGAEKIDLVQRLKGEAAPAGPAAAPDDSFFPQSMEVKPRVRGQWQPNIDAIEASKARDVPRTRENPTGQAPTEAAGAVSQPEAATPAPQAETAATAPRSLTEAIQQAAPQIEAAVETYLQNRETVDSAPAIGAAERAKFAEVLASKERRSNWGKASGLTEEQVQSLIQEAVSDGRLTMRKGQPVRTAKARAPSPQTEVARAAVSVPMGRAAERRLEKITSDVAYKHAAAILGAGPSRDAAIKKLSADKKATRAVLDEIHLAVTGKSSKGLRTKQAVIDALAKAEAASDLASQDVTSSAPEGSSAPVEKPAAGHPIAGQLLDAGIDQAKFDPIFATLSKFPKAELDTIANEYRNRPAGGTYRFKFKSKAEALKSIRDVFIERHEAASKRAVIERLTKWDTPPADSYALRSLNTIAEPVLKGHYEALTRAGTAVDGALGAIASDRRLDAGERQQLAELYVGEPVEGDPVQAIREAAAQRGREARSALLHGFSPEVSPSNLRIRDLDAQMLETALQRLADRLPRGAMLAVRNALRFDVSDRVAALEGATLSPQAARVEFGILAGSAKKIIAVSLEYGPDVALQTFTHEEIHLLRQLGVLKGKDWEALAGLAKRRPKKAEATRILDNLLASGKIDQEAYDAQIGQAGKLTYRELYQIDARYGEFLNGNEDLLVEETVAHVAADWAQGREFAAPIERALQKIRDFIEAIQNFFVNGFGARSANDVFESIWAGELTRKFEEARERRFDAESRALDWMNQEGITAMAIGSIDPNAPADATTGQSMRRDLDALGYYSQALEAAKSWNQKKGTPEQALMWLKKSGVKDAEIEATGLRTFLEGKQSVTREEVVGHLEGNRVGLTESKYGDAELPPGAQVLSREELAARDGVPVERLQLKFFAIDPNGQIIGGGSTRENAANLFKPKKWSSYSLDPDNPTYRETVLHLPVAQKNDADAIAAMIDRGEITAEEGQRRYQASGLYDAGTRETTFRSGHFPEPNIIGHMMTSMTTHQGKPVYTIDQIQSDWGQSIRARGVRDEAKIADLRQRTDAARRDLESLKDRGLSDGGYEAWQAADANHRLLTAELRTAEAAVPDSPLVNTTDQWVRTTLRRAIRQAAEADAEYIAIPTGDTVLKYNPGDTEGMRGFYGSRAVSSEEQRARNLDSARLTPQTGIVPKNLRNLLQKIDKSIKPEIIETLDSPSGKTMLGDGFTLFPLTDKVKQSVISEGQPMFAFAGERAKTADREALAAAKRMESEGATRDLIWRETGWFRGVDGRWRFEIDDSKSKLRAFGPDMSMLGIELTHDPMFDAYPELVDVEFNRVPGTRGVFEPGGIIPSVISIGKGVKDRRSVTLHEAQHAVQDVEQFAEGGNPGEFTYQNSPMFQYRRSYETATDAYRRLAGEVEARTVQRRMNLTADQREDRPPWLDYDVPEDQQIIRMPVEGEQRSMASIRDWIPGLRRSTKSAEQIAADHRRIAINKPIEKVRDYDVRREPASTVGGINYQLYDGDTRIGHLMIDAPRHLQPTMADMVTATNFDALEAKQPIAGTVTRIEVNDDLKGKGLGTLLLDMAEADLKEAGAILHPGDTNMTQDFINLYAKRDPEILKDAFKRMGITRYDDESLMLDRAMRERENRGQPMLALRDWGPIGRFADRRLRPTPPQSTPEGESPGLNKIISDLKKTMGMTVSQGLWGFSVQQGNRSARVRPPSNVRGQFDRETGNVSLRQSRDIKTLAHEGGHYLESILGTDLGAIKQAHAEALTGDPAPLPAALSEGFANWFRDYILDPDAAESRAPGMTEAFEELLEAERPDMLEGFDTIQQEYKRYITSAPIGEIAAGLSSQYDGTTWRELSKDKALDNISGKLSAGYQGVIDGLNVAAKGVSYLLKTADANGIRDEDGRPISVKVGDNFYKRLRLFAGSFNRGRVWLDKGVSDLETGRIIGPSLKAALEKALGDGKFDMKRYKDFNQYLVSIRAIAEYDRLDQKAATVKQYDDTLAKLANARPMLAERLQKDAATLERRQDALTRANAMLADRRRMLGAAETRLENIQERLDGVLADIAEAGEMDALAQDIADPLAENAVSENYGAMVARRRRQVQNLERQQREALRAVERLSEEVSGRDVEVGMLQEEIRQISEGVARGRQQVAQLDDMVSRVRKERELASNRGASRPPTAEPRAVHERVIRELGTPEFQEAAKLVHDFTFSLLEARRQAGFIPQELFDELAKRKDWYVPFWRDMSDIEGAGAMFPGSGAKKWSMFKKFDGSDRSILMPMEILSEEAYSTAQQIAFNDMVKAMIGLAERVGPGGGKVAERLARAENMEANEETFGKIRQMAIDLGVDPVDAHMMTQRMEMNFSDGDIRVILSPENLGPTAKPQLPLWENGERVMVRLPDPEFGRDLFEAINGLGKEMSDILVKALALPAQALRIGVTTHPDFIFRNIWRDIWTAWKLTGAAPFVTQYRGFQLINEGGEIDGMSGEDFRRLYNEAGGIAGGINVNAQISDSRRDVKDLLDTNVSKKAVAAGVALGGFTGMAAGAPIGSMLGLIFGGPVGMGVGFKIGASIGGLVGGVGVGYAARHGEVFRAVESVETATRLGVAAHAYKRAKEHNPELSDLEATQEAAFVSRDIIDWNRRGSKMLAATRLVTFLNAQIQGLDKQFRQMGAYGDRGSALRKHLAIVFKHQNNDILSRDEERDLADAYKSYMRWGAITLMLMGLAALYSDDDDYQDIKDETKATHSWFKALGIWFRLPKPFELAVPGNIGEIVWDKIAGRDQRMGERIVDSMYEVLAPPGMPQVMRLTGGILFNRDRQGIFSGRSKEIVGENLASRPPHERYHAFTSEFAIDLSNAMYRAGVPQSLIPAPVKTDFVLSAAGAYWGREVQNSYQTAKTIAGMSTRPDRKATDFPILRGFTGEAARMSRAVNDMWTMISREGGEMTMAATEYKQLMDDRGRPAEAEMWLKSLDKEQQVWALTQYYGSRSEKREHPLERASQADRINREIMRDTISDTLAPKRRQGRKTVRDFEEKIELTPAKKLEVIDILARLSQVEARNTMILLKRPGFEGMDIKDPQLILDELKAASPEVHDLLQERRDKKVPLWVDVYKEWPKFRERVLKESVNAF